MSQGVPQVIPQIPCDFKWQPSARVSQTIRSSSLSCDSSHHVTEAKCPPQPTHLLLLQRVDSTDDLAPWKWLGGILLPISLWKAQQEYWHLHNSLQEHTDLRAHDFVYSPHLWHEPRLANCRCAWSQRLCGITCTGCMCVCVCVYGLPISFTCRNLLCIPIQSDTLLHRQKGTYTYDNNTSTTKCT